MRILYEAAFATIASVALALTQADPSSMVVIGVVVLLVAVRSASLVVGSLEIAVGFRARAHREAMIGMPEPRHPSTAGLPLTRAPSPGFAA